MWRCMTEIFALSLALLLTSCSQKTEGPAVGIMEPETGQNSVYGSPAANGALLALEQAKSEGVTFSILGPEDIAAGGELARQAYSRLMRYNPVAIVGPGISNDMLLVGPLAQRDGVVMIGTTCENVKISEIGDYVFRVYPSYLGIANDLAEFAVRDRGSRRIAIIAERSNFGRDFTHIFQQRAQAIGGRVSKIIEHAPEENDFRGQIIELLASNPDSVLMSSQVAQMQAILRQIREAGYTGLILAPSSFYDQESVSAVGTPALGMIVAAYAFDISSQDPKVVSFRDSYRARFGAEAPQWAAYGWDAALPIIEAIRSGARTSLEIRDYISRKPQFSGLTGNFHFDQNGDVALPGRIYEVTANLDFRVIR